MYQLTKDLHLLRDLFAAEETSFVFDSMLAGLAPSKVFVNDLNEPTMALVWDGANCFYFAGTSTDESQYQALLNYLKEQILDDATRQRLRGAKVYYSSEIWQKILLEGLQEFKPVVAERVLFKHNLEQIPIFPDIEGVQIKEINAQIVNLPHLGNLQLMEDEICGMWGTVDKFLQRGFGYCAIQAGQIICWCTGEYFSDNHCGIGIETLEQYQKRGVATQTAAYFVQKCRDMQRTPYWDSWKSNTPSVRVAEKVGFSRAKEYSLIFVRLDSD